MENCIIKTRLISKYRIIMLISLILLINCKNEETKKILIDINVNQDKINLVVGETFQLKVEPLPVDVDPSELSFRWESINNEIATVTTNGMVKGISAGKTDIIVSANNNSKIYKQIPVTVSEVKIPLQSISVSPEVLTIEVEESVEITAKPEPSDATGVIFSWESDHSDIASVSTSGLVTGRSAGSAVITVKSGDVKKDIPVQVVQSFRIQIGKIIYKTDTIEFKEIVKGVKWFKFNVPEFVNGFGTLGKGLVVSALEVDLSNSDNKVEVCPASQATKGNVERPSAMYSRKLKEYQSFEYSPVAVVNGDFYLLSSGNNTGYAYINNRPLGMEISNGMLVQTPFSTSTGFMIKDNGEPEYCSNVTYSGQVFVGEQSFKLSEVNGFANAGELVMFNNLSNSYPSDSAFAWSPYTSTMVSLSFPENGWQVNNKMEFTVQAIDHDIETTIPAKSPYKGKDFNGQGAILVGNNFANPEQSLTLNTISQGFNSISILDKNTYWEVVTTGNDPYVYTSSLTSHMSNSETLSFEFEYQSATDIPNFQIFYGKPGAAQGVSTNNDLQLHNTGIAPSDENKWKVFSLDLKVAVNSFGWGNVGHTLRLDFGNDSGNHILIRNMKINATFNMIDSKSFLDNLEIGDKVGIQINIKPNGQNINDKYLNFIGCHNGGLILQNGNPVNTWNEAHPRTAIGYSKDKKSIYMIVVDGRQNNYSVGATTEHLGDILKALGAYTAINLDGGGSSCMVVMGEVKNKPSDGSERAVANGIMVFNR